MITIIEGPDGAGKTTLAKYIAFVTNSEIIHFGKPANEAEHIAQLSQYADILANKDNIVLDRSWLSDLVYAKVMKDREFITTKEQSDALLELGNGKAIVIFCNADIETLWQRCQDRGETYVTQFDKLLYIRAEYMGLMQTVSEHLPVLHYEFA